MRIGKSLLIAMAIGVVTPASVLADDYVDDIYFNPKKDKNAGAVKKNPNYIENFSDMDVDAYNLRGQYYTSPVDTIGNGVGSEDDFVYTQQIQKYYNPTIVLDNEELLADVLENSYGNVEIVYNGLTPTFLPVYGYGWPYYAGYYNPWAWNIGWYDPWYVGPSWSWAWGPSWSWGWNWGPSWGWGPGWGWGGPSWGWGGPGHGPGWGRPNSTWSPGGNRPVRPGVGWAGNGHNNGSRPAVRPGNNASSGSQWSIGGNHRGGSYGQTNNSGGMQHMNSGNNRTGYTIGTDGHRYRGTGTVGTGNNRSNSSVGNQRTNAGNTRTGNTYNSTTQRRSNSSTTTNRSYNSTRSSGNGSFGSGSFGGSSHRSSGGGGGHSTGRGTRR